MRMKFRLSTKPFSKKTEKSTTLQCWTSPLKSDAGTAGVRPWCRASSGRKLAAVRRAAIWPPAESPPSTIRDPSPP